MVLMRFFAVLFSLFALSCNAADGAGSKPNILIILADDLGYSDLGCYGGEIRTPHLDSLAANGLRFQQFYTSTRCCPSRASLLTGLYPHQAGIGSMTYNPTPQRSEKFPGYHGALNNQCVTIAQVLKTVGYRTAAVGKWHVGNQVLPTSRGFDDFYGFVGGYGVDSWDSRVMIRLPEGKPVREYHPPESFYATNALTDQTLEYLAEFRKENKPWLLYLAYQAPHFPIQSKAEDMTGYADVYAKGWDAIREARFARQKEIGAVPTNLALTPRSKIPMPKVAERIGSMTTDGLNPAWESLPEDRRADLAQRMAVYAGMVSGMDRGIGRILADLKASGQLENTLILFTSDNGACAEWEPFGFEMPGAKSRPGHGIDVGTPGFGNKLYSGDELARMGTGKSLPSVGSAWANASNTPWRQYKHYTHEGGISSPLIAHWPAGIKAKGEWRTQAGHLIDILPTCTEAAGASYPAELDGNIILPREGKSLLAAFANQPVERDFLAFEHEGNRALRQGKWKIVSVGNAAWELYDIDADRTEMKNLAAEEPQRVAEMAELWKAWAKRTQVLPRP